MKKFAILFVIFVCICACKSHQPIVQTKVRVERDTVERVDSVRVVRYVYIRGDTVHVTDTVEKFRNVWRDRVEYARDSVPYVQEVQVPVPVRMRDGYDRFTSWGFWILLLLALARLAWLVYKTFYLRK